MMESSALAGRPAPAVLDPRRWRVLALLCGAFFMVLLDGTITIVALPSIGADLGFSKQDLPWVLSAYALTFGGLLLLGGRAADLLGRPLPSPAPSTTSPRTRARAPSPH
jgi:MFS family permease